MSKNQFAKEMQSIQTALEAISSIDESQRQFAINTIATRLGLVAPSLQSGPDSDNQQTNQYRHGTDGLQSTLLNNSNPKAFLASKKPSTAVEQIACLAYFLTYSESKPHFKTRDLTALNTRAAGTTFTNAAQASVAALRQNHYLTPAGKGGLRQITTLGEEVVKALPNRDAVKAAIATHKGGKRKPRKRRKSA
jgi:hypothetical protein